MDGQLPKLRPSLKRYLARLLKTDEDIEDVAQDAFLRVLEAESKGSIHYPQAYLYRTARNLALNKLAKKSYQLEDYIDTDVIDASARPDDEAIDHEHFELMCRAVAQLPEQCRRVFVLRKVYGFSQKEVSEMLGISTSTVEKHIIKGLSRCTRFLETKGYP